MTYAVTQNLCHRWQRKQRNSVGCIRCKVVGFLLPTGPAILINGCFRFSFQGPIPLFPGGVNRSGQSLESQSFFSTDRSTWVLEELFASRRPVRTAVGGGIYSFRRLRQHNFEKNADRFLEPRPRARDELANSGLIPRDPRGFCDDPAGAATQGAGIQNA